MKKVANTTGDAADPPKQRRKPGRVPVSCAECRRLKLRCDRQVPCEKCVKRGCSAICPEGALTTGNKTNRLAFADADELQKKVERLRDRVHTLEDALRTLQSNISDDQHPLLQNAPAITSSGASPIPRSVITDPVPSNGTGNTLSREDEEFLDAFGTLTLGLRGESRFFGQTSRSEYLIHAHGTQSTPETCRLENLPRFNAKIYEEATKGYDTVCEDAEVKKQVLQLLPTLSEACRLCDIFLEHGDYLWHALPRTQLYDEILSVIYRSALLSGDQAHNLVSAHAAAVLFMVFALATLMDSDSQPYSSASMEYYLLSRLCLRFVSPIQDTTVWAIQTLIYQVKFLGIYDVASGFSHSHYAWIMTGFAVKLGHSIGLHVKSSRWQLDEEASQRRANVFWQLFLLDTWLSFGFGRPPCMSLAFVDCEFPKDPEESIDSEGNRDWGYHPWSWQYAKLLHNVMTTAFGAKAPHYSTILELDRRIRDFPTPWRLRVTCSIQEDVEPSKSMHMQRWFVMSCKEITLLNLHRPYFAQALSMMSNDLLKHRYGPSVIAIYRASWRLIEGLISTHKKVSSIVERLSYPWSQALSAAIVMCLLVTRAPTSCLASASLHELDRLCEIFEKLQDKAQIAAHNLDAVRKMRSQAHDAMNKADVQTPHDRSNPVLAELDRIGGKTHLISRVDNNTPAVSPNSSDTASTTSSTSTTTSSSSGGTPYYDSPSMCAPHHIHPVLINDMRAFEEVSTNSADPSMRMPNFDFDLSHAFPLPADSQHPSDWQTFQDITGYFGSDFFDPITNAIPSNDMQQDPPMIPPDNIASDIGGLNSVPVPVLHATWQSFVEQLGF